jgi:CPA2 family monovalent cation:H+ antiporter-2
VNPLLDVVVRTHSEDERQFLQGRGVDEVVLGEWELALEMTRHALQRFGVDGRETETIIQNLRRRGPTEPEEKGVSPLAAPIPSPQ